MIVPLNGPAALVLRSTVEPRLLLSVPSGRLVQLPGSTIELGALIVALRPPPLELAPSATVEPSAKIKNVPSGWLRAPIASDTGADLLLPAHTVPRSSANFSPPGSSVTTVTPLPETFTKSANAVSGTSAAMAPISALRNQRLFTNGTKPCS